MKNRTSTLAAAAAAGYRMATTAMLVMSAVRSGKPLTSARYSCKAQWLHLHCQRVIQAGLVGEDTKVQYFAVQELPGPGLTFRVFEAWFT